MNTNLEYYKIFYYVAGCGGITAAAEKLCISQPAVSQSIRQLEKQIGGTLFVRTPRGVRLTQEGAVLYAYVKKGYETIERGEAQFLRLTTLENGEIRIGASDMTLKFYLLPYLQRFHDHYPGIKVIVSNAPTPETLDNLKDGEIDFGVVSTPVRDEKREFVLTPVREIEDVFVAGGKFANFRHRTVPYEELIDAPLICLEKNTSTRAYIDAFLKGCGVTLNPEFELATSDMIVQFALRNLGIGCVVRDFAQPYLERGELFSILFERRIPNRKICVATAKTGVMSSAAAKLLEMMELKKN